MPAVITVDQNQLGVWYRVNFPSGEYYIVGVEPVTPGVGREVFQTLNENYTLVFMMYPERKSQAFMEGIAYSADSIITQMGVNARTASFLESILFALTLIQPADYILELAQSWYERNQ